MPAPANPSKRDFYVYRFKVDGYPFYVGVGRSGRGPDRLRYVRSLSTAKLRQRSLTVRVMAALDERGKKINYSRTRRPLNRREALALEKILISRLLHQGFLLTNWQHNPLRHNDTNKAVRAILSKQRARHAGRR
jgi:hypothetical protein